jgi:hypothetical protein
MVTARSISCSGGLVVAGNDSVLVHELINLGFIDASVCCSARLCVSLCSLISTIIARSQESSPQYAKAFRAMLSRFRKFSKIRIRSSADFGDWILHHHLNTGDEQWTRAMCLFLDRLNFICLTHLDHRRSLMNVHFGEMQRFFNQHHRVTGATLIQNIMDAFANNNEIENHLFNLMTFASDPNVRQRKVKDFMHKMSVYCFGLREIESEFIFQKH